MRWRCVPLAGVCLLGGCLTKSNPGYGEGTASTGGGSAGTTSGGSASQTAGTTTASTSSTGTGSSTGATTSSGSATTGVAGSGSTGAVSTCPTGLDQLCFSAPVVEAVTAGIPRPVAIADVGGDQHLDVLVALDIDQVQIFTGAGDGSLTPQTPLDIGNGAEGLVAADADADGFPDIVTCDRSGPPGITVALSDAGNGFLTAAQYLTGGETWACGVALVDTDDVPDLVGARYSGFIDVLLGNGDGTFAAYSEYPGGNQPTGIGLGLVDGDDNLDVVTANFGGRSVSLHAGNGAGGFGTPTTLDDAVNNADHRDIALADFDDDGDLDIITTRTMRDEVAVLLGDGAGAFGSPQVFGVGEEPGGLAVGDVNGDGNLDAVVANYAQTNVSVMVGTGLGVFTVVTVELGANLSPWMVAIGDLNEDGADDVVVTAPDDAIVVLLTDPPP